jgi:hypothetical protein
VVTTNATIQNKKSFDRSGSTMKHIRFEDDLLEQINAAAGKGQFSSWVKEACRENYNRAVSSQKAEQKQLTHASESGKTMEYKFLALSSNKTDRYEVVVFETEGQIGNYMRLPGNSAL